LLYGDRTRSAVRARRSRPASTATSPRPARRAAPAATASTAARARPHLRRPGIDLSKRRVFGKRHDAGGLGHDAFRRRGQRRHGRRWPSQTLQRGPLSTMSIDGGDGANRHYQMRRRQLHKRSTAATATTRISCGPARLHSCAGCRRDYVIFSRMAPSPRSMLRTATIRSTWTRRSCVYDCENVITPRRPRMARLPAFTIPRRLREWDPAPCLWRVAPPARARAASPQAPAPFAFVLSVSPELQRHRLGALAVHARPR